jgi:hypothetical protein
MGFPYSLDAATQYFVEAGVKKNRLEGSKSAGFEK